jgi:membrane-bound lytic murein transglycosylase B
VIGSSAVRRLAPLVAVTALAALAPPVPASADELSSARAEVAAAEQRVADLQPRLDRALGAYDEALGALAAGVTRAILAEEEADDAARAESAARRRAGERVRALYMTGGASALVASVLTAPTASDALRQVTYVQTLVAGGTAEADALSTRARRLQHRADELRVVADGRTVVAREVQERYAEVAGALAAAAAELAGLSEQASRLAEAEALANRIAALNAAVAATGEARVEAAQATGIPPRFRTLYERAARTCRGMAWSLLAAVGQVESNHGANPGTSYAGAQGPMQFMPATFRAYAVDGDDDGDRDIHDPDDAVFSAANYLCANGAGRGGPALERAVWHYNHADWYVRLVLKLAG